MPLTHPEVGSRWMPTWQRAARDEAIVRAPRAPCCFGSRAEGLAIEASRGQRRVLGRRLGSERFLEGLGRLIPASAPCRPNAEVLRARFLHAKGTKHQLVNFLNRNSRLSGPHEF